MEGEGQGSGNEETPYTVVVQIPNPYGDSSGKHFLQLNKLLIYF